MNRTLHIAQAMGCLKLGLTAFAVSAILATPIPAFRCEAVETMRQSPELCRSPFA
jgi:hypothetical protein